MRHLVCVCVLFFFGGGGGSGLFFAKLFEIFLDIFRKSKLVFHKYTYGITRSEKRFPMWPPTHSFENTFFRIMANYRLWDNCGVRGLALSYLGISLPLPLPKLLSQKLPWWRSTPHRGVHTASLPVCCSARESGLVMEQGPFVEKADGINLKMNCVQAFFGSTTKSTNDKSSPNGRRTFTHLGVV